LVFGITKLRINFVYMDLNKAMIIGRLTRDPEIRSTPNGTNVCQLGVATSYVYTNQQTGQKVEQTEFHNVVLWRKLADIAAQYLKKGARVYIEGRLQTRQWEGQDGVKRNRTEIIADNLIMLDSRGSATTATPGAATPPQTPQRNSGSDRSEVVDAPTEELPTIQTEDVDSTGSPQDVKVEDIPF
jgi:single-strand DNA-binding protein